MELPLKVGLEKVGLPIVVTDDTPHLTLLIDTGATHNILFSYVCEVMGNKLSNSELNVNMNGIEGNSITCTQAYTTLKFGEQEVPVVFSIMDATSAISNLQAETGVQLHGILGTSFLKENQCLINFKNYTLNF